MRSLLPVILGILIFAFSPQVQAAEYTITVVVDETTDGDMAMIGSFLGTAEPGTKVSRSLRRLTMGSIGELNLLVQQRVDDLGYLTLDDGSLVSLIKGDTINVQASGRPNLVGAFFPLIGVPNPSGNLVFRAAGVCFIGGPIGGTCVEIPPKHVFPTP